jgi:SAM-dependent methyltransferase
MFEIMLKNTVLQMVRKLGLMNSVDRINFFVHKVLNHSKNKTFAEQHPGIKLPPAYTLYEAYRMDYENYFNDGKQTANALVHELSAIVPKVKIRILDWGCGPARVVRHLPALLTEAEIYGSDYNPDTIAWCKDNIPDVQFDLNSLQPPLSYQENFFDAVYALSVFTHLSKANHYSWLNELHRIIKPGGVLLLSTQGEAFKLKLTAAEKHSFSEGRLVVRDKVKEGHRSFSAFQPEVFMQSFFSDRWKVLKFAKGSTHDWGAEQDTWIVKKV